MLRRTLGSLDYRLKPRSKVAGHAIRMRLSAYDAGFLALLRMTHDSGAGEKTEKPSGSVEENLRGVCALRRIMSADIPRRGESAAGASAGTRLSNPSSTKNQPAPKGAN